MGATEKRWSNMLFSFYLIISVGPIDFGSTDKLKRQCYSIFLSFQWLDPITRLFSLVSTSPGTARQYQNARAVPRRGGMLCCAQLRQLAEFEMGTVPP
jgi:hypothetical protein